MRSRLQLKSTLGERWKACAYLSFMCCLPLNMPSGASKTASSVKRAAAAAASFLLYASSKARFNVTELIKRLGNPEKITLLAYSWISRVCLLGEDRQNTADRESA
jgi:hypothetical protein